MDREELGFNAWVMVGNVLNSSLRGAVSHRIGVDEKTREILLRLEETLDPVQPPQVLEVLQRLSPEDRQVLLEMSERAFAAAREDAPTLLGLDMQTAQPVLTFLRDEGSS